MGTHIHICIYTYQNKSKHFGVFFIVNIVVFASFQIESSLVSCSFNDTQMSTLPLDDLRLIEECEVQFQQRPAEDEG